MSEAAQSLEQEGPTSNSNQKMDQNLKLCNNDENDIVQSFSLLKTITQGSTAQICLVKNKQTNELLVQKSFFEDSIQSGLPEREYQIMKQISEHQNILKLQDCQQNDENTEFQLNTPEYKQNQSEKIKILENYNQEDCLSFPDEITKNNNNNGAKNEEEENPKKQQKYRKGSNSKPYLHLEYCENGELFEYVKMEKFQRELSQYYFIQLIQALQHLHQNHSIAHRDIKLENILMDKNFQLKLADFGFAYNYRENNKLVVQEIKQNESSRQEKENVQVQVGTFKYMAPELFIDNEIIDLEKVDVFACGVTLFSMHIGFSPIMERAHPRDQLYKFFAQNKQDKFWTGFQRKLLISIDQDFQDLINKMLEVDSQKRIDIEGILRHPWVMSYNQEVGLQKIKEQKIIEQMKYRKSSFEECLHQVNI